MEIKDFEAKKTKIESELKRLNKELQEHQQEVMQLNNQINYLTGYLSALNEADFMMGK